MFGRIRPIPEFASKNFMQRQFGERIAMNSPIQGTAADIIKIAMIRVHKKLKEGNYKSRLILQIHDELLIETYKDEIDEVKQILETEMVHARDLAVPLIAEVKQGINWYEAKNKTKEKMVIGITGGVGCGKSTVLNLLEEKYGAKDY